MDALLTDSPSGIFLQHLCYALGFLVLFFGLPIAFGSWILCRLARLPVACQLGFHRRGWQFETDGTYTLVCCHCGKQFAGGARWITALLPAVMWLDQLGPLAYHVLLVLGGAQVGLYLVVFVVRLLCVVADRFTGLDSYGSWFCLVGRHWWEIAETYVRFDGNCSDLWRCKRCGEVQHKVRVNQ